MRTRLISSALLVALLVLPTAAASAAPAGTFAADTADTIVLATESGGEAPGLEPRMADNEDNEFAPEDYERPWTYWLGVFVLVSTVPVLLLIGLLYYVLVYRHRDVETAGAR